MIRATMVIGLAVVLLGRLVFVFHPFTSDGDVFIYMGKLVSDGGSVGRDMIDNKFPTVGLMTSILWRALGTNWPAYVLLQTALVLAAIWQLYRTLRNGIGKSVAIPVTFYSLVYLNLNFAVDGGFRLESLQVAFAILAASAAISSLRTDDLRDAFLVGLAAGMAAMFKPSGLAVLAAWGLTILLQRTKPAKMLAFSLSALIGLAIPLTASLIYFASAGLLSQILPIFRQVADYASHSRWDAWDAAKWGMVLLVAGLPLLIRFLAPAKSSEAKAETYPRSILFFAMIWLLIEAAGILVQGRMYPYHFLPILAPAALLFGLIPRTNRPTPLLIALTPAIALSSLGVFLSLQSAQSPWAQTPVSEYLAIHATRRDAVWMDYMPRVLIETGLKPGSRYTSVFLWANDDDAPQRICREILGDFQSRRPRFIVLPTDLDGYAQWYVSNLRDLSLSPTRRANFLTAWSDLSDWVRMHYKPAAQVSHQTVYESK